MDRKKLVESGDKIHRLVEETLSKPTSNFVQTMRSISERYGVVLLVGAKIGEGGTGIFYASGDKRAMILALQNALANESDTTFIELLAEAAESGLPKFSQEMDNDVRRN